MAKGVYKIGRRSAHQRADSVKVMDLHTHTCYSDGTSTVENSLMCAQQLGLAVFSVTDHNTVDAYDEILRKRELFEGDILPGVELSTVFCHEVIEILGYGVELSEMRKRIRDHYPSFYDKQVKEARLDTLALLERGVVLGEPFVRAMLEHPESIFDPHRDTNRPYLLRELRRYPENARFFTSREEFETISEQRFTREYLFNAKSPLFSDQSSLGPDMACVLDMIHQSGGLAFLAHPLSYSANLVGCLKDIADSGIDGMECYYGTFSREQRRFLMDFCIRHNLYQSGGSDFHGLDMRPQNRMGRSSGDSIPMSLIEPWLPCVKRQLI